MGRHHSDSGWPITALHAINGLRKEWWRVRVWSWPLWRGRSGCGEPVGRRRPSHGFASSGGRRGAEEAGLRRRRGRMIGIARRGMLGWWWAGAHGGKTGGSRRRRRLLLLGLVCLSPVLLPLACLSFPVICVLALYLRFGAAEAPPVGGDDAGGFLRGCEEGEAGTAPPEGRLLLHRYLEDQLGLVGSVVWDCYGGVDGGDDDDDDDSVGEGC